ncbi:MAG: hypothetical protein OEZ06_32245 [Myxococcales bacterium]|nr:hypothetical protein [Myxococcales bacterium]
MKKLIFGRSVEINCRIPATGELLQRELSNYPDHRGPTRVSIEITPDLPIPDEHARNPVTHATFHGGFAARFPTCEVSFRTGQRLSIRVATSDTSSLRQRVTSFLSHPENATPAESFGQAFHELVLVPSVYFDSDLVPVHASAFQLSDGTAVLIGGTGGVGKTSLELSFCLGGEHPFVSDDIAVVDGTGQVWPNLAYPKIYAYNLAGSSLRQRVLAGRPPLDLLHWHYRSRLMGPNSVRRRVDPGLFYGACAAGASQLAHYFVLRRDPVPEVQIEGLTPADAAAISTEIIQAEYQILHNHLIWHEYNSRLRAMEPCLTIDETLARFRAVGERALSGARSHLVRIPNDMRHDEFLRVVPEALQAIWS